MDIIEQFAQKMLDEKLDFLSISDAIQLTEIGIEIDTRFAYVANVEELGDDHYNMTSRDIYTKLDEMMGDYGYGIGNPYNHFDEFTVKLAPAPTYIDLLKHNE